MFSLISIKILSGNVIYFLDTKFILTVIEDLFRYFWSNARTSIMRLAVLRKQFLLLLFYLFECCLVQKTVQTT